uniref:Amino acid transporter transmembrane domain-containing protein n=1 Tax=Timema poppense TaxID=170557 RepID=A0A7R9H1Y9_TIMPO|nr:unnamed protein product [Timema poppensis]
MNDREESEENISPNLQIEEEETPTQQGESGHPYLPNGDERGQLSVLSLSVVLSVLPKRHGSLVNIWRRVWATMPGREQEQVSISGLTGERSMTILVPPHRFTLWNTMLGSSTLAISWAVEGAGFFMGIATILFMALLMYYTASLILELFKVHVLAPKEPTFYPSNYRQLPDVLDLILTDFNQHSEELHTLNELDSDHLPIFCRLLINTNIQTSFLRRNTPNTDWPKYKATLERAIPGEWEVGTTEEVDHSIALLTATLLEAHRTSTNYEAPLIKLKRDHPDLNLLRAQKGEARHDWQTSRSPRYQAVYNRLRALVRRRAKQLKLIQWNEFVSENVNGGDNVWTIT